MKPLLENFAESSLGMSVLLEKHKLLECIRHTLHEWITHRHIQLSGFHIVAIRTTSDKIGPFHNPRTSTLNNRLLIIFCDDSAIASRLKNLKPSLLECLKKYDIGDIRIKTKPILRSHHQAKRDLSSRTISKSVAAHLLQVCPNTSTGQSLYRLVKNAKKC